MELWNKYASAYPETQTHTQKGTDSNPNPVLLELDSTTYGHESDMCSNQALNELDLNFSKSTLSGFGVRSDVGPYVAYFQQWADKHNASDAVDAYVKLCVQDLID
jgi:hypothetical protein